MANITYRRATAGDIPALATIRSLNRATQDYWSDRIASYMDGSQYPTQALSSRILFVATNGNNISGFVAGHLTTRYACGGELQWIDVLAAHRRSGIGTALVKILADWFLVHNSRKICVDPGNEIAREFYRKMGAADLNEHWMFWENIGDVLKNPRH